MMSHYGNKVIVFFCLVVAATAALFCALPALLTVCGYDDVLKGVTRAWPSVAFFGEQKFFIFLVTGCLLLLADSLTRPLSESGQATTVFEYNIFWAAIAIWAVGVYVSYLALPISILLRG
jgi:hypothetical protein